MAQQKFTPTKEQVQCVIVLRAKGLTNAQIMVETGLTTKYLTDLLHDFNIHNPQTKRAAELTPQILKLQADNHTPHAISLLLGIHRSSINRVLEENGIPKRAWSTNHLDDEVISMRMDGVGWVEIAKLCDIGISTVHDILARNDIDINQLPPIKEKPKPTTRTCKDCPEKGEQSIDSFDKVFQKAKPKMRKEGAFHYRTRCKVCFPAYRREQATISRKKNGISSSKKMRNAVSKAINKALKGRGSSKKDHSCFSFLPYTAKELQMYIERLFEPWMNWDNYGAYTRNTWNDNDQSTWTWNLDHIIPQAILPYMDMTDENFQICWALSNLRPYSAKQNGIDGATRIRHKEAA